MRQGGGAGRRLVAAAMLAAIVAALGGVSIGTRHARAADDVVKGFAFWPDEAPGEFQRVARTGANTAYLDVYWQADSPDANSVHAPQGTTQDAVLISAIQKATAAGLRVVLMPKVACNGCAYGWRGFLNPQDPHAFMQSYGDMVTHYAMLAEQQHVWLLFLGSEMNNLEQYADDWRHLRDRVRGSYAGLITYQPNWDHLGAVSFWDALDLVTVSAYFPLTSTPRPSVAEIKRAWRSCAVDGWRGQDWFGKLAGLANATGKQVMIGEVGYRSSETAA